MLLIVISINMVHAMLYLDRLLTWFRKLKTVDIIFTTVKEQICTVHTP